MTTVELVAIGSAIVTGLGGPPTLKAIAAWVAARRERGEDLEKTKEANRHAEELAETEAEKAAALARAAADEVTGQHRVETVASLAHSVKAQSGEIAALRKDVNECKEEKRECKEEMAANKRDADGKIEALQEQISRMSQALPIAVEREVRKTVSSPGFRPPTQGGQDGE